MTNKYSERFNVPAIAVLGLCTAGIMVEVGVDATEQSMLVEQTRERAQEMAAGFADGTVGRLHDAPCQEKKFDKRRLFEFLDTRRVEYNCGDIIVSCRAPKNEDFYNCAAAEKPLGQ